MIERLWLDVRWTARLLRKRPAASLAIVAILASAVGVATVLGSVFVAAIYDPPAIDAPDEVARVWWVDPGRPSGRRQPSVEDFTAWREASRTLTTMTAYAGGSVLVGTSDAARVASLSITPAYFALVGRQPILGRAFTAGERADAIILSSRLWRDRFNADAGIVGRIIRVDGDPRLVIGVMPDGFWFPARDVDVWRPLDVSAAARPGAPAGGQNQSVDLAARLAAGATWDGAQSELDVLAARRRPLPGDPTRVLVRSNAAEAEIKIGPGLQGLVAPALMILFIACANVGNLLIMRASGRDRDLAVRAALGATRGHFVRLALVEAVLLAAASGVGGWVIGSWGLAVLRSGVEAARPGMGAALHGGSRALLVAGLATLVTLGGTAAWPAIAAARRNISARLGEDWRRPIAAGYGLVDLMIVLQVGLAVVMVVTTVLIGRFMAEIVFVQRPPAIDGILATTIIAGSGPADRPAGASSTATFDRILEGVAHSPSFEGAALANALPAVWRGERLPIAASPAAASGDCRVAASLVSRDYFQVVRLGMVRGRVPDRSSGPAAVVSAAAARKCWSAQSSEAWQMRLPAAAGAEAGIGHEWIPVVAVAENPFGETRLGAPATAAAVWIVGSRDWPQETYLLMRPRHGATGIAAEVTAIVERVERDIAIEPIRPLTSIIERESPMQMLMVSVMGTLAALALALAFTGVYAALSHSCAQRLRELGVRLALGASAPQLALAALRRDLPLVVIGVAAGGIGTVWVSSITWREIVTLGALDVRVWLLICAPLVLAALAASVGPILAAIRVDPISVLRAE